MSGKRITPAEVVEAFKKTGFNVQRGNYFNLDKTCACGLGVMYADKCGMTPGVGARFDFERFREFSREYSSPYMRGFALGFDGKGMPLHVEMEFADESEMTSAMVGHQDGIDAWEACEREGLVG